MTNEREIIFIGKFQKKYSFINLLVYPSTDLFTFLCLNYLKIIVFFLGLFYKIFLHQTLEIYIFWLYFFIFIPLNSATYIRDFLMAETKLMQKSVLFEFNPVKDGGDNQFFIGFQGPECVFNQFVMAVEKMSSAQMSMYNSVESVANLLDEVYRQQNLTKPYTYMVTRPHSGKIYNVTVGVQGTVGPKVEESKSKLMVQGDNGGEKIAAEMQKHLEQKFAEHTKPGEDRPTLTKEQLEGIISEAYKKFGREPPKGMRIIKQTKNEEK